MMMMDLGEALSGRAGAQGVRWVLRGATQGGVLRRQLAGLLLPGRALGPCRLRRAKFKPGRRLTAYYDILVESRGDWFARPIAVTWDCNGVEADLEAETAELQGEARRARLATPFARLQASSPDLGLRILVSPLDPRFPQLVRVSDPRYVRRLLAETVATACPVARQEYRVSAVRYRPGQRHVLRYQVVGRGKGGEPGPEKVFAKLYRNGEGLRASRWATAIADWLATRRGPVAAAIPLCHTAADDLILYPEVPGVPLSACIARGRRELADPLRRAGEALRLLQGVSTRDLPAHGFDAEVQALARTTGHIQELLPELGARIRAILERAAELHERLPKEPPVFAHGDYKADHLFVQPGRLTLIDFDRSALADPALDVGKFLADLDWWYAASGRDGLEQAKGAFLDGYGRSVVDRIRRARLFEALILTKIAAHRLPVFSPTWARDTARLIARAEALTASS